MSQVKKYSLRVVQDQESWTAEIIRRISSKKTVVSKREGGFATEAEAHEWATTEVKEFVMRLGERNKRHSKIEE